MSCALYHEEVRGGVIIKKGDSVLFGGTVPPNSVLFGGTVPPNSFPH